MEKIEAKEKLKQIISDIDDLVIHSEYTLEDVVTNIEDELCHLWG